MGDPDQLQPWLPPPPPPPPLLGEEGSGGEGDDEHRPPKRHQAKNLVTERKRQEKVRDRLLALRAIVPKITKMDKASILGDAIEYVKELQQQAKDLHDQLEEDNAKSKQEVWIPNKFMDNSKPLSDDEERKQQMEPQVEVKQLMKDELFLMVLWEHKEGGFARLIMAMNALGLKVTNATPTTFRSLALNVFRVQRRDELVVQADRVKNLLLQMTRD